MNINVRIDDSGVREAIRGYLARFSDLTPAMKIVGDIVRTSVVKNFEVSGRPNKWEKSKKKSGMTLINRHLLMNSIHSKTHQDRAEVGTNVIYAAIHQFGGQTAARTIKPVHKKALFWAGAMHPVKSVNHPGSKIPARPFLLVQDEDWTEIRAAVMDYIAGRKKA